MLYWGLARRLFFYEQRNGLAWHLAPNLTPFPWLVHAFGARRGGARRPAVGLKPDEGAGAGYPLKNCRAFVRALHADRFSLASLQQIHSAEIFEIRKSKTLQFLPSGYKSKTEAQDRIFPGDAMLTHEADVLLSIRTADCLPILIVDPDLRAVAAVHSGWRGALKRVVEKTVGEMQRLYGSKPEQLLAALGPCIRACCYEVGEEVLDGFTGRFVNSAKYFKKLADSETGKPSLPFLSAMPPGHERLSGSDFSLDLDAVARDQLCSAGLLPSHIQASGLCTSCRTDLFFSYRKEGSAAGRMIALIGMRAPLRLRRARRPPPELP